MPEDRKFMGFDHDDPILNADQDEHDALFYANDPAEVARSMATENMARDAAEKAAVQRMRAEAADEL